MSEKVILEGWLSILSALISRSRKIETIYIRRDRPPPSAPLLARQARRRGVPLQYVDETLIERQATGQSHGGAIALAGPRRYLPLESLGQDSPLPFVVMLEGVEDPFNFGQAIRALYAAGANGLVVGPRDWSIAAGIVARASAGASELVPTARVEQPREAVEHFQSRGFTVACTANQSGAAPIYQVDLTAPLFVIIGGERRGISRAILRQTDLLLRIPYGSSFQHSLGTTSSAAILAFEVLRQRQYRR